MQPRRNTARPESSARRVPEPPRRRAATVVPLAPPEEPTAPPEDPDQEPRSLYLMLRRGRPYRFIPPA